MKLEKYIENATGIDLKVEFAVQSTTEVRIDALDSMRNEVFRLLEGEHKQALERHMWVSSLLHAAV